MKGAGHSTIAGLNFQRAWVYPTASDKRALGPPSESDPMKHLNGNTKGVLVKVPEILFNPGAVIMTPGVRGLIEGEKLELKEVCILPRQAPLGGLGRAGRSRPAAERGCAPRGLTPLLRLPLDGRRQALGDHRSGQRRWFPGKHDRAPAGRVLRFSEARPSGGPPTQQHRPQGTGSGRALRPHKEGSSPAAGRTEPCVLLRGRRDNMKKDKTMLIQLSKQEGGDRGRRADRRHRHRKGSRHPPPDRAHAGGLGALRQGPARGLRPGRSRPALGHPLDVADRRPQVGSRRRRASTSPSGSTTARRCSTCGLKAVCGPGDDLEPVITVMRLGSRFGRVGLRPGPPLNRRSPWPRRSACSLASASTDCTPGSWPIARARSKTPSSSGGCSSWWTWKSATWWTRNAATPIDRLKPSDQ